MGKTSWSHAPRVDTKTGKLKRNGRICVFSRRIWEAKLKHLRVTVGMWVETFGQDEEQYKKWMAHD